LNIYAEAFIGCTSLENIEIPDTVTYIGKAAFNYCESLISIEIPKNAQEIIAPFENCIKLEEITVDSENTYYFSDDGILFDIDKTTLICYPAAKVGTDYTIPDGVINIDTSAFYECDNLSNIEIPETVTTIKELAFAYNDSLINIEIPASVTSIERAAFMNCTNLTNIEISPSVTIIEEKTFEQCDSLTDIEIPYSVTTIGRRALYLCDNLAEIKIPSTTEDIHEQVFYDKYLSNIIIYCQTDSVAYEYAIDNEINYICDDVAPTIESVNIEENIVTVFATDTGNSGKEAAGISIYGYSFDGGTTWQRENTAIIENSINETSILVKDAVGNISEYKQVQITYNANGGTGEIELQTVLSGESIIISDGTGLTREGYTFAGWNTSDDGTGITFEVDSSYSVTEDLTLYAQWEEITYTIGYDLTGGVLGEEESNPETYTVKTESFELVNPSKVGYTFVGWTGTGIEEATKEVTIAQGSVGNREYIANWTANENISYTVNYYLQGTETKVSESKVVGNKKMAEEVTEEAIEIAGYMKVEPISQTVILKAEGNIINFYYTANTNTKYTVEHYLQNVEDEKYTKDEEATETKEGKTGEETKAVAKTYEGFTAQEVKQEKILGNETTVVKVYYTRNTYKFTLDTTVEGVKVEVLVDGEVSEEESYSYGEEITIKAKPEAGYEVTGWESSDKELVEDQTGEEITIIIPAKEITIKPKVSVITYTIGYDLVGGALEEGKTNPSEYTVETESFKLVNPSKAGYTFVGWTGTGIEEATKEVTIEKGSTGNREYTANWEDTTSPEIEGIETKKVYTEGVTPEITDEGTGVEKVEVTKDGKVIEYTEGEKITQPGEYTIIVEDAKGNKTEKSFMIIEVPEGLEAIIGQLLKEVKLPKGFNWEYKEGESKEIKTVGKVGENKFTVTYTPEDTTKYKKVEGIEVKVIVKDTLKLTVTSKKYIVNEEKLLIENVQPEITINEFIKNIETNATEIKITEISTEKLQETEVIEGTIKTGMKVTFKLGEEIRQYQIVVKGDVNGDGEANIKDIFAINSHRLSKINLMGVYEIAGDVNEDGEANIKDILEINSYRLKKMLEL